MNLCLPFLFLLLFICAYINSAVELESIDGINYRICGKKGSKDEKPWFDSRALDMRSSCVRRGRCIKTIVNASCFGARIPYEHTSIDLTDYHEEKHAWEQLNTYRALQFIPKCWAVIQPFLCSVFAPKCEEINGQEMIYLPSLEMCRLTLEPCRILYNTSYFPDFLRCNESLFPSKCNNVVREMKFNITGYCPKPLVPADSSVSYYPGIEGCGVQCKDPMYTDDEHRQIHKLTAWAGTLCLLSNLFVVATFVIDWEHASKYPALIVFYINLCFLVACIGWLVQFTPGSREDIVCRKDGTLRFAEPTAGENLSCVVVFVLVYYFLMAAMVWFVFLTYIWHLRAVGNVQERIDKKGSYFHLVAWSLPLVLTITTMALSEVDGNSTVGICFVGYLNHSIRGGLLLGPLCAVIIVSGYFIMRGMIMLFGLKNFAKDIKSISASNKIHLIIVRMGLCAIFTLIFILVAIACNLAEFRHTAEWADSLRTYIICQILSTTDENLKCKMENRPSVALLQLHLLCLFGAGIIMSTWCWTPSSMETWKRYMLKKCGKEVIEEVKMPKHKVIAQTWAKRKEFEDKGRLSITLYNTHTDPVGLNFDVNDLNSSETNEISSTWANYLPQFVKRRMALTGATGGAANTNSSSHGPRKNSVDSEISFSVCHVSVESRRNSVDSQVSVKIAEVKTKVASRTRNGHYYHTKQHATANNKRTQKRRDFTFPITQNGRKCNRRESSTSIESQVIALRKTTHPPSSHVVNEKMGSFFARNGHVLTDNYATTKAKTMSRRSGNVGLDSMEINKFLIKNEHLIMPFLQQHHDMSSSSADEEEDELQSHAAFKFQDSHLNVVLKHDNAEDDGIVKIEELGEKQDHSRYDRSNNTLKQTTLETLLKNMQKSQESTANRNSRNSSRSRNSRKSQTNSANAAAAVNTTNTMRHSKRKYKKTKPATTTTTVIKDSNFMEQHRGDDDNDGLRAKSASSHISSSCELDLPLSVMLHSSYSELSVGKPNSRSSKTSCDVGIQANAYEIATQTLASYNHVNDNNDHDNYDRDDNQLNAVVRALNGNAYAKNRRKSGDNDNSNIFEMQSLLCLNQKDNALIMSESEKLKLLLLPSK